MKDVRDQGGEGNRDGMAVRSGRDAIGVSPDAVVESLQGFEVAVQKRRGITGQCTETVDFGAEVFDTQAE